MNDLPGNTYYHWGAILTVSAFGVVMIWLAIVDPDVRGTSVAIAFACLLAVLGVYFSLLTLFAIAAVIFVAAGRRFMYRDRPGKPPWRF